MTTYSDAEREAYTDFRDLSWEIPRHMDAARGEVA